MIEYEKRAMSEAEDKYIHFAGLFTAGTLEKLGDFWEFF